MTWEFTLDAPPRLADVRQVEVTNRYSILESAKLEGKTPQFFLDQIYAALRSQPYANKLSVVADSASAPPTVGAIAGGQSTPAVSPGRVARGAEPVAGGQTQVDPARLRFEFSMLISQTCRTEMIETPFSFGSPTITQHWLHRVKEITLSVRSAGAPTALGTVKVVYAEPQDDFQGPLKDVLWAVDAARQRTSGMVKLNGPPGGPPAKP